MCMQIAPMLNGRIDIKYRRVACTPPANINVQIDGNSGTGGWLRLSVTVSPLYLHCNAVALYCCWTCIYASPPFSHALSNMLLARKQHQPWTDVMHRCCLYELMHLMTALPNHTRLLSADSGQQWCHQVCASQGTQLWLERVEQHMGSNMGDCQPAKLAN